MGVGLNHGGYRGTSPPEFGVGDANANCSPRFCHVSKFQTSDCLNYNVVMQKKAYRPNPIILTEYSLFPKSTSSTSTKSPHRADNSTFFRQRHGQKSTTQNAPKHAISSENSFFLAPSPVGRGTLPTLQPSGSPLRPPEFKPDLRHCIVAGRTSLYSGVERLRRLRVKWCQSARIPRISVA